MLPPLVTNIREEDIYEIPLHDDVKITKLESNLPLKSNSAENLKINSNQSISLGIPILYYCITIPFVIVSIFLGGLAPGKCDHIDKSALTVAKYLLVTGVFDSVIYIPLMVYHYYLWKEIIIITKKKFDIFVIIHIIFSVCWSVVGAFVLFRSNKDCINEQSSHVVYALFIWILDLLNIIYSCWHFCKR